MVNNNPSQKWANTNESHMIHYPQTQVIFLATFKKGLKIEFLFYQISVFIKY
jgi:hypothetical protein